MATVNAHRVGQQFRNFQRVLDAYAFNEPLSRFLSGFYKENRQMGSSDRRITSRLCYDYFRLGNAVPHLDLREKLTIATFLCETESDLVASDKPLWLTKMGAPVSEKLSFLEEGGLSIRNQLFPFVDYLSKSVDKEAFVLSHLTQPDLFIRVQHGKTDHVEQELQKHAIPFERVEYNCYRLPNGSRLQDLKKIEGYFEVQDLSSQQAIHFVDPKPGEKWWDACAGSGGKSLMLLDTYPHLDLLVSDVRMSVLRNLKERFQKAYVRAPYHQKILDLTADISGVIAKESFDGILLDAPCSGSGTWGRTPEMMQPFTVEKLSEFSSLQKKITGNVIPYLKPGGILLYITCSVFEAENENIVQFLEKEHGLAVEKMEIIKGYLKKADSMFIACLRKN